MPDQRPMTYAETTALLMRAWQICQELDKAERDATPEHKAAALLVARIEILRCK